MMVVNTGSETDDQRYARARKYVYDRLAIASAVIWTLGTLILTLTIVPYTARPQPYLIIASLAPLVPAAIPWMFFSTITRRVFHRWSQPTAE
jgi:hypothetical protein